MNRSNTSAIVLGLLLFSAALAAAVAFRQPAIAATNCSTSSAGVDSAEQQVVSLINDARAAIGVAPLAISTNLSRAAAWKSEDPSASPPLSHTDSLGRSPTQRSRDCGYNGGVGENIAWGFPSAEAVFNGWMGSSGHRSNLLSSNYAVIGVGRSGTAWTTDFGLVADGGSPPPPTATPTIPVSTATEPPSAIPSLTPPVGTATPPQPTPDVPAPSAIGISIHLAAGFNLVTYAGPSQPVVNAFSDIRGELWVYDWDPGQKRWFRFFRSGPEYLNTLVSVEHGRAYMIWVAQSQFWDY